MSSHQRFGNKSNSKPSSNVECIESPVQLAAPQCNEPPPVSRAHLRVIQSKSRDRNYG